METELLNGSFDGNWVEQDGISPLKVFLPWRVWWKERQESDEPGINFRPEAVPIGDAGRYRTPPTAQKVWNQHATHIAGLLQGPIAVPVGAVATFQIYVKQYSEDTGSGEGEGMVKIGIDPFGGTDPFSDKVVWSEDLWKPYDDFKQLQVQAVSQGTITVFTHAQWKWKAGSNDTYWDDAKLLYDHTEPDPPPQSGDDQLRIELRLNDVSVYDQSFKVTAASFTLSPITSALAKLLRVVRIR